MSKFFAASIGLLFIFGLSACTFGSKSGVERDPANANAYSESGPEFYNREIKPIFQNRCVQCHSCYNAPCQMKMTSVDGLDRGLIHNYEVFTPAKFHSMEPSRLGIDRKTTIQWRNFLPYARFMPVTQDTGNAEKNIERSYIYRLVAWKRDNASLPVDDLTNPNYYSEDSRICPNSPGELVQHLQSRPSAGMPYGLPALSDDQIQKIQKWTEAGSPRAAAPIGIAPQDVSGIREVESFLNSYLTMSNLDQAKRQSLVSRFIYEHLFLAHLYMRDEKAPENFYRLIRSSQSCEAPNEIATRRPWDAVSGNFFYCFQKIDEMIVHKTHITYLVDHNKVLRWQSLFLSTPWTVSYQGRPGVADVAPREDLYANNPFMVFKDIPVKARYQFLLDNAQYHVMTFIKGPVCKGSTAVNSIDEQFYVFFLKPEADLMVRNQDFVKESLPFLYLPAYKGSDQILGFLAAGHLVKARNDFRIMRDRYYGKEFPHGYAVTDIWNGLDEGGPSSVANTNAALTVLRHQDSAIVTKGLVGATSKTSFVLDYATFERFYYDLVSGFDVFGDVTHQVHTRLYMSYIKMEAEENFLSFLPSSVRAPMRRSWYVEGTSIIENLSKVGLDKMTKLFPLLGLDKDSLVGLAPLDQARYDQLGIIGKLSTLRDYRRQLVDRFKTRLGPALVNNNELNYDKPLLTKSTDVHISDISSIKDFERELAKLSDLPALNSRWVLKMTSSALLLVESPQGPEIYTFVRNKEHLNIAWMGQERARRSEASDTMVFYKGVLTSYPNYIYTIDISQAKAFLEGMMGLTDFASYDAWSRKFGNPRDGAGSEKFWPNSDRIHQVFQQKDPLEFGILDYNRYGVDYRYNRDEIGDMFETLPPDLRKALNKELGTEE